MPEPTEKPKRRGQFSAESAKAAAAKRWEKAKAASAESAGDASDSSGPGAGSGLNAGLQERDRDLALREARRMLKDKTTPDAVKAQLIRTLAGIEEAARAAKPPAMGALEGLQAQELEALVLAHL